MVHGLVCAPYLKLQFPVLKSPCTLVQEAAASSSAYAAEKASQEGHISALQVTFPLIPCVNASCCNLAAGKLSFPALR